MALFIMPWLIKNKPYADRTYLIKKGLMKMRKEEVGRKEERNKEEIKKKVLWR